MNFDSLNVSDTLKVYLYALNTCKEKHVISTKYGCTYLNFTTTPTVANFVEANYKIKETFLKNNVFKVLHLESEVCYLFGSSENPYINLNLDKQVQAKLNFQSDRYATFSEKYRLKESIIDFLLDAFSYMQGNLESCKLNPNPKGSKLRPIFLLNAFEEYINTLQELAHLKPLNRQRTGMERGQMENLLKASHNIYLDAVSLLHFFMLAYNPNKLPEWGMYYVHRDKYLKSYADLRNSNEDADMLFLSKFKHSEKCLNDKPF